MQAYPIQFSPIYQARVWGGRGLETLGLNPPQGAIGEAWVLSDHPNGMTPIANGELKDRTFSDIPKSWFGTKCTKGRFPLLVKLLDCHQDLSIQVHPNDHYQNLPPQELGKTEMWYVLHAEPGAKIVYGLKEEITRERFIEALNQGQVLECMKTMSVQKGDSFYIPSGTVHALCAGVIVAEIQQNSDTTYRIYDYDRLGLDGQKRELHLHDALEVIKFGIQDSVYHSAQQEKVEIWENITQSPYFIVENAQITKSWAQTAFSDSFTILMAYEGSSTLTWEKQSLIISQGSCVLIPANFGSYEIAGHAKLLRTYLP